MPWIQEDLLIPSTDWQFSKPLEGTFFELKHITSDLPYEYFRGEICQAEIDGENIRILGAQPLDTQKELDVVKLTKPACFTERRIGIRRNRSNTTVPPSNKPLVWEIAISRYEAGEVEPPPPPPPAEAPSAAGVAYTASQSSTAFGAAFGTYATLTDGNRETGACVYQSAESWLKATFPEVVRVTAVTVGGGNVYPGFGTMAQHCNDCQLQYSNDDQGWTTALTIAGVADSGPDNFKKFTLPSPVEARYWRLFKANWVGTTEFKFE